MCLITKQDTKLLIINTYWDTAIWVTLAKIMKIVKYYGDYLPNPYSNLLKH